MLAPMEGVRSAVLRSWFSSLPPAAPPSSGEANAASSAATRANGVVQQRCRSGDRHAACPSEAWRPAQSRRRQAPLAARGSEWSVDRASGETPLRTNGRPFNRPMIGRPRPINMGRGVPCRRCGWRAITHTWSCPNMDVLLWDVPLFEAILGTNFRASSRRILWWHAPCEGERGVVAVLKRAGASRSARKCGMWPRSLNQRAGSSNDWNAPDAAPIGLDLRARQVSWRFSVTSGCGNLLFEDRERSLGLVAAARSALRVCGGTSLE